MLFFAWTRCLFLLTFITIIASNGEVQISGQTAHGWEFIRDLFKENFAQDRDLGGSVAIYHQGELVVDLWGGWFDNAKTKPYNNDTLQLVFSTSKGLVAAAVALCVQRNLLNYSALVTNYWPEYGANGKGNTTVAHILSHRAGLPIYDPPSFEQYYNWTAMVRAMEQARPLWVPGTAHGYHAVTYGWLAGELVRRVDPRKRSIGQFIREDIAQPSNIEFYIGLPAQEEYRVSPLNVRNSSNPYEVFNTPRTHQAEIPAANGITNARSVAKLYALLIGDVGNQTYRRILNEATLQQAIKSNTRKDERDWIFNTTSQRAMGFSRLDEVLPALGSEIFGHQGYTRDISFFSL